MFMSEVDLPTRLAKYEGDHVRLKRIALTRPQVTRAAVVSGRRQDARTRATSGSSPTMGTRCWELDAMDPNDLRDCVEREIKKLIEPVAWQRCEVVNKAEQDSLRTILSKWKER